MDITLTADQDQAVQAIMAWLREKPTPYRVLGGYAGTGKTTLIAYLRALVAADATFGIKRVAFCSFTGKAASVLRSKLKEQQALHSADSCSTIHGLMYTVVNGEGGTRQWRRIPVLDYDLIVIDEGSMVNRTIWYDLLSYHIPILVCGDHGQLPPVEGTFNLMEQPDITLETIVRQAEGNPIIRLSRHVRQGGDIPFGTFRTVRKLHLADDEALTCLERLVTGSDDDYLVLCGTNRTRLQVNAQARHLRGIEAAEPQKHERVICLKNNHTKLVYNGMLGVVERIAESGDHWYEASIRMEDSVSDKDLYQGAILRYQFGRPKTLQATDLLSERIVIPEEELGDLFDFGYALTVHKAQGSEARQVLLFEEKVPRWEPEFWQRWLYTAVSRAREELVVLAR